MSFAPTSASTDGEASNPGPGIASVNMTSLPAHFDEVTGLPASLVCGQETRLCEQGQIRWRSALEARGWQAEFGKPMKRTRRGAVAGGVCVLARTGIALQSVPMTKHEGPELWESGRVIHAALACGTDGKTIIHVFSFYGFPNSGTDAAARAKNEHLLQLLFAYIARLGNVAVFIGGDFNTPRSDSAALSQACGAGFWDASASLGDEDPTCFLRYSSRGTRIDMLLANSAGFGGITSCHVERVENGFPTHCPIFAEVDSDAFQQSGFRYKTPAPLPAFAALPEAEAEAEAAWEAAQQSCMEDHAWETLCTTGTIDEVYQAWSSDSERYIHVRAKGSPEIPRHQRGRGEQPRLHAYKVTAPHQSQNGAEDISFVPPCVFQHCCCALGN